MQLPTPQAALALVLKHWLVVALSIAVAIQTVRIEGFKIWPLSYDGLKAEAKNAKDDLRKEREANEKASDEQRQTTERNVIIYRDRVKQGKTIAERIEAAPTEGNCKTSGAVMGEDL